MSNQRWTEVEVEAEVEVPKIDLKKLRIFTTSLSNSHNIVHGTKRRIDKQCGTPKCLGQREGKTILVMGQRQLPQLFKSSQMLVSLRNGQVQQEPDG
jgi:hypothetical protein